jgi:hypothetical protein
MHQLGDGPAIACTFHDGGADECDGFRIVELEATALAALGQQGGGEDQQLVFFARGQFYEGLSWVRVGIGRR